MKKVTIALIITLFAAGSAKALKPIQTEGFDKYRNSIKLDLASTSLLSPQVEWEYMSDSRLKIGTFGKAYITNRSTFSTQFESKEVAPKTVVLNGSKYDVNWNNSPGRMYGEVQKDGETYEVRWDRRYTGVMLGPQARFYMGKKPDRGFYFISKIGLGLFQESFDVFMGKYSLDEQQRQKTRINNERQAAQAAGQSYSEPEWEWGGWKKAGNEKSDFKWAVGAGAGLGVQGWFDRNSHWGYDIHCLAKYVYSKVDEEEHSQWEWFLGPGFILDYNASIVFRF